MREIYADHAATTFPRPPEVAAAITSYLNDIGCSPGRGGYRRSLDAARLVYDARSRVADFFNADRAEQVIFTPSVTYSINLLLKGLLQKGDHVLASSIEHNSVVRPLSRLTKELGLDVEYLQCSQDSTLNASLVREKLRPQTKLVILTHASNVTGALLPVYEVGEILAGKEIFYAVDVAQTAGSELVDMSALRCDYLAFTGHKGLLGPPGIGGLCLSERAAERTMPLVEGGTGSRSEDEKQPGFLPDKFESGTQNVPGIAGLDAGIRNVLASGREKTEKQKRALTEAFLHGLSQINGITVYGPAKASMTTSTVSISIKGMDSGDLSFILDQAYGIMTRSGLHCSPHAHRTIGTFPAGTLRFSFGFGSTLSQVTAIVEALQEITAQA
jgi:cysteine desulfurase family protein